MIDWLVSLVALVTFALLCVAIVGGVLLFVAAVVMTFLDIARDLLGYPRLGG